MALLDISLLKRQLRLDPDDADEEDELLALYLAAAETAASHYMGRTIYPKDASVPDDDVYGITLDVAPICVAILMSAALFYEQRLPVVLAGEPVEIPLAYHHLLGPYRILFPELGMDA